MTLIDPNHPFYRPLWVRLAIVAVTLGWVVIEVYAWEVFWLVLAVGASLYCIYMLLIVYKPPQEAPPERFEDVLGDDDKNA